MKVNLLVTLDPVGWTRPNLSSIANNSNYWINYNAIGRDGFMANAARFIGRGWGSITSKFADGGGDSKLGHAGVVDELYKF